MKATTMHRAKDKQHRQEHLSTRLKMHPFGFGLRFFIAGIISSSLFLVCISAEPSNSSSSETTLCDVDGIKALGMESGEILDSQITASSSYDLKNVGPQNARLNREIEGGAWCPESQISSSNSGKEWIQVNLTNPFVITKVVTSGRFGNSLGVEFTENFLLNYTRDGINWIPWINENGEREMEGNVDTYSTKENVFIIPLVGVHAVRLMPSSKDIRMSCLRLELYGCRYKNGPISYSMRLPDEQTPFGDLIDDTYDGYLLPNSSVLEGGLGQLVDGIEGPDDLKTNEAFDWVAWKTDEQLVIKFEFNDIQNFTNARFHCHNLFSRDIQVFKAAKIWFSLDNLLWSRTPEDFEYMPDRMVEKSRYIVVHLHNRIGKFIKFDFKFSSKWLLLSEVRFNSQPVNRGLTSSELGYFLTETTPIKKTQNNRNNSQAIPNYNLTGQLVIIVAAVVVFVLIIFIFVIFLVTRKPKHKNINSESEYASVPVKDTQTFAYSMPHNSNGISPFSINEDPDYAVPDVIDADNNAQNLLQYLPQSNVYNLSNNPSCDLDDGNAKYYASIDVLSPPSLAPTHEKIEQISFLYTNYQTDSAALSCQSSLPSLIQRSFISHSKDKLMDSSLEDGQNHQFKQSSFKISSLVNIASQNAIPILKDSEISIIDGQFGYSKFGECELGFLDQRNKKSYVLLKTLSNLQFKEEFLKEMIEKWRLSSQCPDSFACFYGYISKHDYLAIAFELGDMDLKKFLQTCPTSTINFKTLMSIAYQISSGMQDLHSKGFIHRDLAARNCLIYTSNFRIKLTDSGAFQSCYKEEYYKEILPIRWMSFESVLKGKFTNKSDVYSFGVTLFELMSLCQELPHNHLTDEQIFEAIIKAGNDLETKNSVNTTMTFYNQPFNEASGLSIKILHLNKPLDCPNDIYNLILKCCQLDERCRPEFNDITYLINKKLNL